jgi:hypothetical protein
VYIFRNSQRGLTRNVSSRVIFILPPLMGELTAAGSATSPRRTWHLAESGRGLPASLACRRAVSARCQ